MTAVTSPPTRTNATAGGKRERPRSAPIITAVDGSTASRAAVEEATFLASELEAPLVFVHVRRRPAWFVGAPFYQRRLSKQMEQARRALDRALRIAEGAEVEAEAEILEGPPRRRIVEFAQDRDAQLVIVGSRRRRIGRSVARAVARAADRPVVVTGPRPARRALAESFA